MDYQFGLSPNLRAWLKNEYPETMLFQDCLRDACSRIGVDVTDATPLGTIYSALEEAIADGRLPWKS